MSSLLTETDMPDQRRRDLRLVVVEGSTWSLLVGCGETYFAAYVLAMGFNELAAGLVASVPTVCGAALQLITPWGVSRLGSHKRWVVISAAIQALSLLPLIIGAAVGSLPLGIVYFAVALYWAGGWSAGAAWNTWVGTLVPPRIRTRYFAMRSRWVQIFTLFGLTIGAWVLQSTKSGGIERWGFVIAFGIAMCARLVSTWLLSRQSEPEPLPAGHRVVPVRELLGRFGKGRDGRLLAYMLAVQTAVQISGPFFSPYMLAQLRFDYWTYFGLIAIAYCSKILTMQWLGTRGSTLGTANILRIGGLGMIPLSALWIFGESFWWLAIVQVLAGTLWGFYEFATFLLLLEHVAPHERTSVTSMYHFAYASAAVLGSMIGAAILHWVAPGLVESTGSAYLVVFGASGIARIATVVLLLRLVRVSIPVRPVVTDAMSLRPNLGTVGDPVAAADE